MSNTARERTLQTISDLEYRDFDGVAAFDTDEWTDAICDIWQPLLKDAHDLLELIFERVGATDPPAEGGIFWRIKEALGLL